MNLVSGREPKAVPFIDLKFMIINKLPNFMYYFILLNAMFNISLAHFTIFVCKTYLYFHFSTSIY